VNTKVVKKFLLDGDVVIFRYPRFSDWIDVMRKVNSLTKEKSFGSPQRRTTGKQNRKWMRERLKGIKENNAACLVVEIRGIVVGSASIWRIQNKPDRGCLEISIRSRIPAIHKKLWGRGIGKKLVYAIMHEAKIILMVKVVELGVYVANRGAVNLYRRCGFSEMYRIRREKNHYGIMRDRIYMKKHLR
jgi:RimJ/RimL family protein N-acetyltransferase